MVLTWGEALESLKIMLCFKTFSNFILNLLVFMSLHALLHVASVHTTASSLSCGGTNSFPHCVLMRSFVFHNLGYMLLPFSCQVLYMCSLFCLTWNAFALRFVQKRCPSDGCRPCAINMLKVNHTELWFPQPLSYSPFLLAAFPSMLNWLFPWHEEIFSSNAHLNKLHD